MASQQQRSNTGPVNGTGSASNNFVRDAFIAEPSRFLCTAQEIRIRLTTYRYYSMTKWLSTNPKEKATWAKAEITLLRESQEGIKRKIKKLDDETNARPVSEKRVALAPHQQGQVNSLLEGLNIEEPPSSPFEWTLCQLESLLKAIKSKKFIGRKQQYETVTMMVFVCRTPKQGIDTVPLYYNIEMARVKRASVPTQSAQVPPPPPGRAGSSFSSGMSGSNMPPPPPPGGRAESSFSSGISGSNMPPPPPPGGRAGSGFSLGMSGSNMLPPLLSGGRAGLSFSLGMSGSNMPSLPPPGGRAESSFSSGISGSNMPPPPPPGGRAGSGFSSGMSGSNMPPPPPPGANFSRPPAMPGTQAPPPLTRAQTFSRQAPVHPSTTTVPIPRPHTRRALTPPEPIVFPRAQNFAAGTQHTRSQRLPSESDSSEWHSSGSSAYDSYDSFDGREADGAEAGSPPQLARRRSPPFLNAEESKIALHDRETNEDLAAQESPYHTVGRDAWAARIPRTADREREIQGIKSQKNSAQYSPKTPEFGFGVPSPKYRPAFVEDLDEEVGDGFGGRWKSASIKPERKHSPKESRSDDPWGGLEGTTKPSKLNSIPTDPKWRAHMDSSGEYMRNARRKPKENIPRQQDGSTTVKPPTPPTRATQSNPFLVPQDPKSPPKPMSNSKLRAHESISLHDEHSSSSISYLSDFEHTKLNAHVYPGMVVETLYVSDPASGQRRIPKTKAWKVERVLGNGGFGEVRLETHAEGNESRAVKRLWASGATLKREYERELKALLEFSKPKYREAAVFIEFFGWFEDQESVYLAMEYIPLGDLEVNAPQRPGTINEVEIRDITSQILEGLKIMHLENFAHRDLKPKNVLVCQASPNWWVKLADFGVSKRQTDKTAYRTQTGTQSYMAPEVLNYVPGVDPESSDYTNAVDLWALGCIVFRLATGSPPFPPGLALGKYCENPALNFPEAALGMSNVGVQFAKQLLVPNPSDRLTAHSALNHEWIHADFESASTNGIKAGGNKQASKSFSGSFGQYNTATHAGLQSGTFS